MAPAFVFLLGLVATLLIAAGGAVCIADRRRQRRLVREAEAARDWARTGEAEAVRALRLAAIELRGPATCLLGHADRLCADGANVARGVNVPDGVNVSDGFNVLGGTAIGAIARQMLDLADDLQNHALADATNRMLRDEPTGLAVVLRDAVAAVQLRLDPGRRHWRVPTELDGIAVIADRRALAQILAHVLGCAARFSRHDDWIDIAFEIAGDRFALIVADEGNGLAATEGTGTPGPADAGADTRGLGFGLALARVLMQAHGGTLVVEAVPSVGTRVTLDFPMSRLVGAVAPSTLIVEPADVRVGKPARVPSGVPVGVTSGVPAGVRTHATV